MGGYLIAKPFMAAWRAYRVKPILARDWRQELKVLGWQIVILSRKLVGRV